MGYRIAVDTGGTFTDVVVADEAGQLTVGKALTTVDRTFEGFSEALANAGDVAGIAAERLLAETEMLIYGTTRSTNSIIEGKVAKTALLATEGFPDTLLYRHGGKREPLNLAMEFPPPYIPRRLTFEIPERINAEGGVERALDEGRGKGDHRGPAAQAHRRGGGGPALVHREPRPRAPHRRADRRDHAGRALHPLAPAQPHHPRVSAHLVDRHRRLAQAADAEPSRLLRERPARRRLRGRGADQHVVGRRDARGRRGGEADLHGEVGARDGAARRHRLRRRRGPGRRRDHRRYRRHHLRREPGPQRPGQVHARHVAARRVDRPQPRPLLGGRAERRRRRRLDRLDRRRRAAARRPAERGRATRSCLLRPGRRGAHRHRRRRGARLHRPRLLPGRAHEPRRGGGRPRRSRRSRRL